MKKITDSQRRKVLALMPLAILPFLTLFYFAFGGGQATGAKDAQRKNAFNTLLPGAQVDDSRPMDKMSLYEKADEDSARQQIALRNDPFAMLTPQDPLTGTESDLKGDGPVESPFSPGQQEVGAASITQPDRQVQALEEKLAQLQRLIDQQESQPMTEGKRPEIGGDAETERSMHALENMMNSLQQEKGGASQDPELQQMEGMLDKILDIQHPQRVGERLRQQTLSTDGLVVPVLVSPLSKHARYFGIAPDPQSDSTNTTGAFYGPDGHQADTVNDNTGIAAIIHHSQEIVSGSTIKIRLDQPVYVKGRLIPKGSFLFGSCNLSGERLQVAISSLRYGNLLFPVKLIVYDYDGNSGIRIPGSISRDASKQAADQAIQSVAMTTLDPSLGAQAASAGIETAKNLLSKKVRLIRVTVKADYPILLKAEQNQ